MVASLVEREPAEFAARVQHRHDDFQRRLAGVLGVGVDTLVWMVVLLDCGE